MKEYDFSKAKRGPAVAASKSKARISIRLDEEVLEWFKAQVDAAGGGNYQTLINSALVDHIKREAEPHFGRGSGLRNTAKEMTVF